MLVTSVHSTSRCHATSAGIVLDPALIKHLVDIGLDRGKISYGQNATEVKAAVQAGLIAAERIKAPKLLQKLRIFFGPEE